MDIASFIKAQRAQQLAKEQAAAKAAGGAAGAGAGTGDGKAEAKSDAKPVEAADSKKSASENKGENKGELKAALASRTHCLHAILALDTSCTHAGFVEDPDDFDPNKTTMREVLPANSFLRLIRLSTAASGYLQPVHLFGEGAPDPVASL